MSETPEGSEWKVVWPAVLIATLLLGVTFAFGYELLHGWMFTVSLVFAAMGGLGLVSSALWPRRLRAFWTGWCPTWVGVALPVAAAVVARRVLTHPAAVRARVDAARSVASGHRLVASGVAAVVAAGHTVATLPPGRAAVGLLVALGFGYLVVRSHVGSADGGGFVPRRLPLWILPPSVVAGAFTGYLLAVGEFHYLTVTFLAAMTLFSLYVWVMLPLAVIDRHHENVAFELRDPVPTVSVLVPAYNERESIERCVESILASDYPTEKLEVFVIDDGSTDDTYERASGFGERVTVLHKQNGGKHSALNYGLLCSESEMVVSIDADSFLEPDAIARSVAKLQANDDLAAIASNVKVENRDRLLTRLQALEYIIGINMFRRAFALFGVVPVIPGCLGTFRREALEAIDGYDPDTATEDFDLTIQLLKSGRSVGTTEAVVWTEAPFTWRDFYSQRRRWTLGSIQTLYRHVDILTAPEKEFLNRFMYPLKVVSLIRVIPLYPAVAYVLFFRSASHFLTLMLFFGAIMTLIATTAIAFEGEDLRLLAYVPFFVVGYRQLLDLTLIRSFVVFVFGGRDEWGEITRSDHTAETTDLTIETTETTND